MNVNQSTIALAIPRTHLPLAEDFLLWPPALQVYGYRIVNQLFASRTIRAGAQAKAMTRAAEIAPIYRCNGADYDVPQFMDRNRIAGLLVIKDGAIRLERYGLGLQEHDRWSTMSTVKSMTAMLAGAAIHDGLMQLDDQVTRFLPLLQGSAYADVSIRHLLTMSSGVRWDEDYGDKKSDVNQYSKLLADRVPQGVLLYMRSLERLHPPGTQWNYNTGDTFVLGAAITASVGMSLADFMAKKIWQPCGMESDAFYTLESEGGQEIGGSRAGVVLRDFGRFAELIQCDGVIEGKRIFPEGWVQAAGASAFTLPAEYLQSNPRLCSGGINGYGYSWWVDQDGAMIANGFAGQRIYINRAEKLSIVTLAAFPQAPYVGEDETNHYEETVMLTTAIRALL